MPSTQGFWSYVHADDQAERGRIAQLARDVVEQYRAVTSEDIGLFLDRDELEWGDDWRSKVDTTLASVAFFIPILTPRYFKSVECRRELNFFARTAEAVGVRELVLPILYLDVPALRDENPDDEAMALIKPFQWVDWRQLRFESPDSPEYRRAVASLVERLAAASAAAERATPPSDLPALPDQADDALGYVDRVAAAEKAMPEWANTVMKLGPALMQLGAVMQPFGEEISQRQQSGELTAQLRLQIFQRMADDLRQPVDELKVLSNDFATQLNSVDVGIRAIIERAPLEAKGDSSAVPQICEFFNVLRVLAQSTEEGLGEAKNFVDMLEPAESMSRSIRPVVRDMRQSLLLLSEGKEVTREWVKMMDASGITC